MLVLRVLPRFGSLMSLCMLFSVALLPAILKLIFWASPEQQEAYNKRHKRHRKQKATARAILDSATCKILDRVFTFLAFLVQGAGIGFPILVLLNKWNPFWLQEEQDDKIKYSPSYSFDKDKWMFWEIPLALVLTSLRWWENFVHRDRRPFKLAKLKQLLFVTRQKMSCVTSLLTSIVCFATFYFMELAHGNKELFKGGVEIALIGNTSYDPATGKNGTMTSSSHFLLSVVPCLMQIIFSFVCYYFCSLACKLMMQKISFVAPLYLSIGATAAIIILQVW